MNNINLNSINHKHLLLALTDTLEDACTFLLQLPADSYSANLSVLSGSSLGQHTRHMLEFLECLIHQAPGGKVNYDLRNRRSDWESDPLIAENTIRQLLGLLETSDFPESLFLETEYRLVESHPVSVPTTFSRELVYNIEHVIHHLALIRVGLNVIAPEIELPVTFGWAPSTLRHREQTHG